jgi:hypothetical protein
MSYVLDVLNEEDEWYHPHMKFNQQDVTREKPKSAALKVGRDKQGNKLALMKGSSAVVHNVDHTLGYVPSHSVIIRTGNYAGHVRGGIAYPWKQIKGDLSRDEAEKIFNRRNHKGSAQQ